jgi:hypothetical protein
MHASIFCERKEKWTAQGRPCSLQARADQEREITEVSMEGRNAALRTTVQSQGIHGTSWSGQGFSRLQTLQPSPLVEMGRPGLPREASQLAWRPMAAGHLSSPGWCLEHLEPKARDLGPTPWPALCLPLTYLSLGLLLHEEESLIKIIPVHG